MLPFPSMQSRSDTDTTPANTLCVSVPVFLPTANDAFCPPVGSPVINFESTCASLMRPGRPASPPQEQWQVCRKLGVARYLPRPNRHHQYRQQGLAETPPNNDDPPYCVLGWPLGRPPLWEDSWTTSGLCLVTATRKRSADDMLQPAAALSCPLLALGQKLAQNVDNANTPLQHTHVIPAAQISTYWIPEVSDTPTVVSNFVTLSKPFHLPWTLAVSTATAEVANMLTTTEWQQQQGTNLGKQQDALILPGRQHPLLTCNVTVSTVSAKILATQRELASLKVLQALQNDTEYPPLHLLLQQ